MKQENKSFEDLFENLAATLGELMRSTAMAVVWVLAVFALLLYSCGCASVPARDLEASPPATASREMVREDVIETASATCRWDANTEPDLAGYSVYRAQAPATTWVLQRPIELTLSTIFRGDGSTSKTRTLLVTSGIGLTPEFTDLSALPGQIYYYRVTAYDTSLNESGPSNSIGRLVVESEAPAAPAGVRFTNYE